MKRATITFPDELEQKLNAYLKGQRTPPSLSTVVQVALDEYLE
jgi:metal-responsive CopG/Arc/MetJ family transcriptional regulator